MQVEPQPQAFPLSAPEGSFVAVNFIRCQDEYRERFEALFRSRAHAIDTLPGFMGMHVLRPLSGEPGHQGSEYLVVSHWESEDCFRSWMKSPAFIEGHKRGFEDVRRAKEEGRTPPMESEFRTYEVLCQ
ncbi:MAG: antibiotic biosynthesis monooxygenase [Fimbriimonadaceae bacterium]|nr:antibiotic biosynthesis monooxygenase [Fimbriimonadaceae bacterium]